MWKYPGFYTILVSLRHGGRGTLSGSRTGRAACRRCASPLPWGREQRYGQMQRIYIFGSREEK